MWILSRHYCEAATFKLATMAGIALPSIDRMAASYTQFRRQISLHPFVCEPTRPTSAHLLSGHFESLSLCFLVSMSINRVQNSSNSGKKGFIDIVPV